MMPIWLAISFLAHLFFRTGERLKAGQTLPGLKEGPA